MRGVVDSEDLPLNVSREMLQEHKSLAAIRRQLTRKVLKLLEEKAADEPETYEKIWRDFGVFLKEGLHIDNAHRQQLTELLRFSSTGKDNNLVSLREYTESMPAGQDAIYYVTGDNAEALAKSPHLEACRARRYPVLLMTDAVDEWVVQDLAEYAGKPLRSVTQGDLRFDGEETTTKTDGGDTGDKTPANEGSKPTETHGIAALVGRATTQLREHVKEVRASTRLTESASCLVDAEGGLGRNMERILRMAGRDIGSRPRILEVNPNHPFVIAANRIAEQQPDDPRVDDFIALLHDQAHLAEGSVPDPAGMVKRIQSVLDKVAQVEQN
jgi:molecular chaperone HtpG